MLHKLLYLHLQQFLVKEEEEKKILQVAMMS